MQDSFTQSHAEQSVMQLVVDQLEELVVTIIEEIRERPGVAAAILAGLLGAIAGSMLAANLAHRRASPPARVVRKARGLAEAAELAGLAVKLMQNDLVRGYVRSAVESQFKKRFSV
ncbi:MAG TPA: hypothetical protein VKV73_22795 [Chloroflexota bacterium]|nr:hypothetical protein [Chloroflexota bacterium]